GVEAGARPALCASPFPEETTNSKGTMTRSHRLSSGFGMELRIPAKLDGMKRQAQGPPGFSSAPVD
ncbi:MAG: hypothetical protein J2P13_09840, partial [Acidobacteria bacterium]|nr:hypothetical protein [Acidobacteriota bacterium]